MAYRDNLSRRGAFAHNLWMLALLVLLAGCATGDLTETSEPQGPSIEGVSGDFPTVSKGNRGRGNKNRDSTQLTAVVISPASVSLRVGATQRFTATAKLSDGTSTAAHVTWTATGGTIDNSGLYTSGSAGNYRVTATSLYSNLADTAAVTVSTTAPATLVSISVSPGSATLQTGATQRFAASGKLSDGTTTAPPVTWTVTGGTITKDGLYTAGQTAGTYRAVATDTSGTLADTAAITITAGTATGCSSYPASRRVAVATVSQLAAALAYARPGDLILLADGTYVGHFKATISGTASSPIVLCGTRAAVLNGGKTSGGGFALTVQASYWTLDGFTVTNTHQGVRFQGTRSGVIRGLAINTVGQEAISLKGFAKHNLVEGNTISNTGLSIAEYGEGIYLGSAPSQWCTWSNCQPDRTDSNTVRRNTIGPYVRSELIDAKEGTAFNRIEDNVFDGRGQVNDPATFWIDSWVEINGDDYVVTGNRGVNALKHGFQTYRGPNGWGNRTYYAGNSADLNGAPGYGIVLSQSPYGVIVRCDNQVQDAGSGLSNVSCK
jgi:hypothetical protein